MLVIGSIVKIQCVYCKHGEGRITKIGKDNIIIKCFKCKNYNLCYNIKLD